MAKPLLVVLSEYDIIKYEIDGKPYACKERKIDPDGKEYQWIDPCIRHEAYEHKVSGNIFTVHLRRGFGRPTLQKHISRIGVFFYRGDSSGEGGSNNLWLQRSWLQEVLVKLIDKGIIVTDGSNCPESKRATYRELRKFHRNRSIGANAISQAEPFTDKDGRRFTCIGYAGEKYGPTLIWQVLQQS